MAMRKFALACLGWLVLSCAMPAARADQLADIRAAGRVRIAIINGLPSFSVSDNHGGLVGSDVETARLLAADLGVRPEFVFVSNAERIPTLNAGKADLIISGLSVTPEREREIAFSVPYASIALVVAGLRNIDIAGYADLRGRKVGVGRNTSNGSLLHQNAPGARIQEYEDEHSLIDAFMKGQFDVISCQQATLRQINSMAGARQLEPKFVQYEYQVAVGMRRGERGLREWVNQWVVSNLASGRLNDIFRRYHGHDLPESVLPKPIRLP